MKNLLILFLIILLSGCISNKDYSSIGSIKISENEKETSLLVFGFSHIRIKHKKSVPIITSHTLGIRCYTDQFNSFGLGYLHDEMIFAEHNINAIIEVRKSIFSETQLKRIKND